jgi:SAM-dependent methyltransferase
MASANLIWQVPEALTQSPAVAYRNRFAMALAELPCEKIVESYVYMTAREMSSLLDLGLRHTGLRQLRGDGIELGSGCGLLAATAATRRHVRRIYAVEICAEMVQRVIPRIAASVLGPQAAKIVPVCGSFDDLELPSESLDFALEIDSLHHSDDLVRTLQELARVLKPGGYGLFFDRCHPDTVSDEDVARMLDQVYSKKFLIANHYPDDVILTRRENGEHEYRMFEWKAAVEAAGLRVVTVRSFLHRVRFANAVKGCLSVLPRTMTKRLYKTPNATPATSLEWIRQQIPATRERRPFTNPAVLAPKDTTVFLVVKN